VCVVDIFNDRLPLSTVAPPGENKFGFIFFAFIAIN